MNKNIFITTKSNTDLENKNSFQNSIFSTLLIVILGIISITSTPVIAGRLNSGNNTSITIGNDQGFVLEFLNSNSITVDGISYQLSKKTKIKSDGFEFQLSDLRVGWKVKLKTKKGKVKEIKVVGIPQVFNFPSYNGLKTRIAVGRVRLGTLPPAVLQSNIDIQSAVESIILGALQSTDRFIVIDIRSRDEILNEVDFSNSQYGNTEIATRSSSQIPAEYLVRGHIVNFGQKKSGGGGFGAFGFKLGSKKTQIDLRMELTIEDIATGTIVKTFTDEITYLNKGSAISFNAAGLASGLASFTKDLDNLRSLQKVAGTGLQFSSNKYYESPIGTVFGLVCNRLVEKYINDADDLEWRSVVVSVVNDKVIIRGGNDIGIRAGTEFVIYKSSDEIIDPETGLSLGNISAPSGNLVVLQVKDKVSICKYDGRISPSRGDICKLVAQLNGKYGQIERGN